MACLEKHPAHRPPSAASVARSLERFLGEGEPQSAVDDALDGLQRLKLGVRRGWPFALGLALGLEVGFLLGLFGAIGW